MRHLKGGRKLGRSSDERQALMRSLAIAMLKHEQIRTTLPKARELRRFVEPFVTRARTDSVANRRLIFSRLRDQEAVANLFRVYGPRYRNRPGGYTRVIKIGFRNGDSAPMALIQFINEDDAVDAGSRPVAVETEKKEATSTRKKDAQAAAAGEVVEAAAGESAVAEAPPTATVAEAAGVEDAADAATEESAAAAGEGDRAARKAEAVGVEDAAAAATEESAAAAGEGDRAARKAEAVGVEDAAAAATEESAAPAGEGDRAARKKEAMSDIEARGVEDRALDKNDPLIAAIYSDQADSDEDAKVESTEEAVPLDADANPADEDRKK